MMILEKIGDFLTKNMNFVDIVNTGKVAGECVWNDVFSVKNFSYRICDVFLMKFRKFPIPENLKIQAN